MELFNKKNIELKNLSFALLVLLPISFIIGSFFVNLLVTIIAFLFFLYQKSDQTKKFIKNFKYPILIFLIFIFLNILNSDAFHHSISKIIAYFRFFFFAICMILILENLSRNTFKYFKALLYLTLFVIFDFYIQFIFGKNIFNMEFDKIYNRYTGVFGDERIFGNFILYFGFFSIAVYNNSKIVTDFKNFLLFFLIALTILLSGDRSPFLTLLFFFLFIFLFSNKKKFILITSIVIFSFSLAVISLSERLSNKYPIKLILNYSDKTQIFTDREMNEESTINNFERSLSSNSLFSTAAIFKKYEGHYSRAIDIFKENPVLGSGFRSYRKVCGSYETMKQPNQYGTDQGRRLSCSIHPHNYHLEILSETGFIGYLIFLSFIIYIFYLFFKKKMNKSFSLSLIFCLILTYIFPFKPTGSFFSTSSSFFFWYLISHFLFLIKLNKDYELEVLDIKK